MMTSNLVTALADPRSLLLVCWVFSVWSSRNGPKQTQNKAKACVSFWGFKRGIMQGFKGKGFIPSYDNRWSDGINNRWFLNLEWTSTSRSGFLVSQVSLLGLRNTARAANKEALCFHSFIHFFSLYIRLSNLYNWVWLDKTIVCLLARALDLIGRAASKVQAEVEVDLAWLF